MNEVIFGHPSVQTALQSIFVDELWKTPNISQEREIFKKIHEGKAITWEERKKILELLNTPEFQTLLDRLLWNFKASPIEELSNITLHEVMKWTSPLMNEDGKKSRDYLRTQLEAYILQWSIKSHWNKNNSPQTKFIDWCKKYPLTAIQVFDKLEFWEDNICYFSDNEIKTPIKLYNSSEEYNGIASLPLQNFLKLFWVQVWTKGNWDHPFYNFLISVIWVNEMWKNYFLAPIFEDIWKNFSIYINITSWSFRISTDPNNLIKK